MFVNKARRAGTLYILFAHCKVTKIPKLKIHDIGFTKSTNSSIKNICALMFLGS
jgi:hypothetical protein